MVAKNNSRFISSSFCRSAVRARRSWAFWGAGFIRAIHATASIWQLRWGWKPTMALLIWLGVGVRGFWLVSRLSFPAGWLVLLHLMPESSQQQERGKPNWQVCVQPLLLSNLIVIPSVDSNGPGQSQCGREQLKHMRVGERIYWGLLLLKKKKQNQTSYILNTNILFFF